MYSEVENKKICLTNKKRFCEKANSPISRDYIKKMYLLSESSCKGFQAHKLRKEKKTEKLE
jgi:hypothetical protein